MMSAFYISSSQQETTTKLTTKTQLKLYTNEPFRDCSAVLELVRRRRSMVLWMEIEAEGCCSPYCHDISLYTDWMFASSWNAESRRLNAEHSRRPSIMTATPIDWEVTGRMRSSAGDDSRVQWNLYHVSFWFPFTSILKWHKSYQLADRKVVYLWVWCCRLHGEMSDTAVKSIFVRFNGNKN